MDKVVFTINKLAVYAAQLAYVVSLRRPPTAAC